MEINYYVNPEAQLIVFLSGIGQKIHGKVRNILIIKKIRRISHLTLHNIGFGTRKIFSSEKFSENTPESQCALRGALQSELRCLKQSFRVNLCLKSLKFDNLINLTNLINLMNLINLINLPIEYGL